MIAARLAQGLTGRLWMQLVRSMFPRLAPVFAASDTGKYTTLSFARGSQVGASLLMVDPSLIKLKAPCSCALRLFLLLTILVSAKVGHQSLSRSGLKHLVCAEGRHELHPCSCVLCLCLLLLT
jgi:hypothetical protein